MTYEARIVKNYMALYAELAATELVPDKDLGKYQPSRRVLLRDRASEVPTELRDERFTSCLERLTRALAEDAHF